MTTASTSKPYTPSDNPCSISAEKVGQIRPKVPLLNILHEAGASGETFTLKEVMYYLGQYIMLKQLYDQQQQHIVHCGNDALGKVFGVQSFSVKDPSQLYEMLSRNLIAASFQDAAQTRTLVKETKCLPMREDHPKCPASGEHEEEIAAWNVPISATSYLKRKNSESDESLTDDLTECQAKKFKADNVSDLWDAAGLPWWFIKTLRTNYGSRKSGSTDIHSNQDIDTAIVSDSTDDLWFLNEPAPDQTNVEIKLDTVELKEKDNCESQVEQGKNTDHKEVIGVTVFEAEKDPLCSGDETDTELPEVAEDSSDLKDSWKCTKCGRSNPSQKQYCLQCWALRKGWHLNCPRFVPCISDPSIVGFVETEHGEGIDVPDCRRSISEPLPLTEEVKCKEKGKHGQCHSSESIERLLQPSTSSVSLCGSKEELESAGEEAKMQYGGSLHLQRNRLGPCLLCGVRPRTGNIIHGKTGHLVACYACAKMLFKRKLPCPVCVQPISTVIKTFVG